MRSFAALLIFLVAANMAAALDNENNPDFEEIYRIKIENKVDGAIEVSRDWGFSWEAVGKVLYPTHRISKNGYAAAKWVGPGRVAASAVNAIHLKVGAKDWSRSIFSILPKEFLKTPKKYRSFLSPNSSIYTNISAGKSIFGGGAAPFVGNVVMLSQPAKPIVVMPQDYVPEIGNTFYILVDRPVKYPKEIVFENRFGGQIMVNYFEGGQSIIGEVLRPVVGIGRFEGSRYVDPGRIRANHAGVIDISTSPKGTVGGFQIVPGEHASDMSYVKTATQWMVIGAADVKDQSLEGRAPFFKYFIHPSYNPEDLNDEDWYNRLLDRFLVEVIYEGEEEWKPMPVYEINEFYVRRKLPVWANSALKKIAYFRILFPIGDSLPAGRQAVMKNE